MTTTALMKIISSAALAGVLAAFSSCATTPVPEIATPEKSIETAIKIKQQKPAPVPVLEPEPEPEPEPNPFVRIDHDVRNLTEAEQSSVKELIAALNRIAVSDREKTRALFIWITHNIAYDTDSFFRGISGPSDAAGTFEYRKSVCEGYATLFAEIGRGLDLEVIKIHGYAKGWGYREGEDPGGTNHAWNAVRVDGKWQLFDATWGAGHVDGRNFHRRYKEFIFSHYPSDPDLQFTSETVSRE